MGRKTTSKGVPDRMLVVEWRVRSGVAKAYYYNNQSGALPDKPKRKLLLSRDRTEAMRLYAQLEGQDNPPSLQTPSTAWEVFTTHARGLETRAKRTQSDYRQAWSKLAPVFGTASWDAIDRVHMIQYLDRRSSKNQGNKEIKLLGMLWNFALNRGLTRVPNQAIRLEYNRTPPRRRYVTDQEYQAILAQAEQPLADAMRLAYLTGQRPSDVLRMTWADVSADQSITVEQSKTGARVEIEALPELSRLLIELRNRPLSGIRLVVNAKGQPLSLRRIEVLWREACAKARVKGAHFADLRAKSASDEQHEATKRLGHQDGRITKRVYQRTATKAKSTA
jgi:integrase